MATAARPNKVRIIGYSLADPDLFFNSAAKEKPPSIIIHDKVNHNAKAKGRHSEPSFICK
jgi:hypothetical protein